MKKILVVGSSEKLVNLVANWFRKYADVSINMQSIPVFIARAQEDPNIVFSGYDACVVVMEDVEYSSLAGLENFSRFIVIECITESQIGYAEDNHNADSLYYLVESAISGKNL